MFQTLGKIIASVGLFLGSIFGYNEPVPEPIIVREVYSPVSYSREIQEQVEEKLGVYNPTGGGTYRLNSSIGSNDDSLTLTSFKEPISNIKYTMSYLNTDVAYATVEPGNSSNREFISFRTITQNSDGTATLGSVARGLSSSYPFTASTTLQKTHAGGSVFILSNSPQFYTSEFARLNANATATGRWAFVSTSTPGYTTGMGGSSDYASSSQFATKLYVDNTNNTGCSDADESTKGCVELATRTEVASSTDSSNPLAIQSTSATSTPGANQHSGSGNTYVVVSEDDGYLNQTWTDLSENTTRTGRNVFQTATTSFQSQTTFDDRFYATSTEPSEIKNLQTDSATSSAINIINIASTSKIIISNSCTGCFKYTGSTSPLALSTASRNMGGTQAEINFGLGTYTIADASSAACNERGTFFVAREGMTSVDIGGLDGSSDGACDGQYTIAFDTSITETTDAGTDSTLAGTIYWYR